MDGEAFKTLGHSLVDRIAALLDSIAERPVTQGEAPDRIREILGGSGLPDHGAPASELMDRAADLLMEHSLFNGHPRFMGYITSSAAPLGMLADLLAAAVNANVGAQVLSPMATEIERQTIAWLAELIGVPDHFGGLCVSGGNMANLTAFLAARTAKAPPALKENGLAAVGADMITYCSKATHTWIDKAITLFGHGSRSLRWIATDADGRMDLRALDDAIRTDREAGRIPFLGVGTAGDVSTGAVDDLTGLAAICRGHDLWFHVDGAYGAPAAALPELAGMFKGLEEADSIALDPHKWLYAPLEAGCTLVKDPRHLLDAFSAHPAYYHFGGDGGQPPLNFFELGLQNSRGFRALKVWMMLQQVGREGYVQLMREDIALARRLYEAAQKHPELQALTCHLSIATLRYVPSGTGSTAGEEERLNALNRAVLEAIEKGGEAFLSNAVLDGRFVLRACIVNFRTSEKDIDALVELIVREGRRLHKVAD